MIHHPKTVFQGSYPNLTCPQNHVGRGPKVHCVYKSSHTHARTLTNKTLHEVTTAAKPDLMDVHAWVAQVFALMQGRRKLDTQADLQILEFAVYDSQFQIYILGKCCSAMSHVTIAGSRHGAA